MYHAVKIIDMDDVDSLEGLLVCKDACVCVCAVMIRSSAFFAVFKSH